MALVGPGALTNDFNGNGIPDIWEVTYLGGLYPGTNDCDGTGFSILYDWLNGIDPNMIQFSLSVTNPYVNSSEVAVGVNVLEGVPASMAVLVNSTNFDSAPWKPYSPNPAVTLGTNDGDYDVWIGLRGRSPKSLQTWQGTTLTRDTVPPALAITSPATSATARPTIQLQGCSDKPLAGVSFDLTNAAGLLANQPGFVTGQYVDTNTFKLTTNSFHGYDLALAPGDNTITLRATDWPATSPPPTSPSRWTLPPPPIRPPSRLPGR